MKTTKTFFLAATVVLLSLFTTSCIPTTPVGGNPTPTPQTDTSVVYRLTNKVVVDLNTTTNNYMGIPVDIDSNGTDDFHFDAYNGNYGYANTNIWSYDSTELASKNDTSTSLNRFKFLVNDVIDNAYFSTNWIQFHTNYNTSGSQTAYAGFRLIKSDGYHYGWMQFKMDVVFDGFSPWFVAHNIKLTLINYAYKIAPNTPIQAGKY